MPHDLAVLGNGIGLLWIELPHGELDLLYRDRSGLECHDQSVVRLVVESLAHVDAERVYVADVWLSVLLLAPGFVVELVKPSACIEARHGNEDITGPRIDAVRIALF